MRWQAAPEPSAVALAPAAGSAAPFVEVQEAQSSDAHDLAGPIDRPDQGRSASAHHPSVRIVSVLADVPVDPVVGREAARVLAISARALASGACVVLHVTAPTANMAASTIARELAATACFLPGCKSLLLGLNRGNPTLELPVGTELPDLSESYRSTSTIQVMEIGTLYGSFHAANVMTGFGVHPSLTHQSRGSLGGLCDVLRHAYNLIILDCPPVPSLDGFLPITAGVPQVLLVVKSGVTRTAEAVHARVLIERMGGQLVGAVMSSS